MTTTLRYGTCAHCIEDRMTRTVRLGDGRNVMLCKECLEHFKTRRKLPNQTEARPAHKGSRQVPHRPTLDQIERQLERRDR